MPESKRNALILHVVAGGEPLVYALSDDSADNLTNRLRDLMATGAVDTPQLQDGNTVTINFSHVVSAHFDELTPLSRVYGSKRSSHGFST